MTSEGHKRVHVTVTGRVQGVGFRYFVCHVADRLRVLGTVRNLRSGGVEVVAEGPEEVLKELVAQVQKGPPGAYVRDAQVFWSPATGEFDRFGISW